MELHVVEQVGEYSHVALSGRLDVAGVQEVEMKFNATTAAKRRPAIVDISGLEFVASMGLGMFVAAAKALNRNNARLALVQPTELVRDVLVKSRLDLTMPIYDSVEQAKSELGLT